MATDNGYDEVYELPPIKALAVVRFEGQAHQTLVALAGGMAFMYSTPKHAGRKADAPDNSCWVRMTTRAKDGTYRYPAWPETDNRPRGKARVKAGKGPNGATKGVAKPETRESGARRGVIADPHGD